MWCCSRRNAPAEACEAGKTSDSWTISTAFPQACVLPPPLLSLYTNSCASIHVSVKLLNFAEDTTLIRLISDEDEFDF
ncbi:hypothetical protein P4O66_014138 [Electrophorus voltai]|uniref:Uncharacterized protein n=1 Tax=Electrophorus voltai TaxID=2609070 RepID=A0AAD8Z079_9TELE|nr:hypothetical protein P4O66_014138 [Electrophorus voltai]